MKIYKATIKDLSEIDRIYIGGSTDETKLQFPKKNLKTINQELERYSNARRQGFRRELKNKNHYWIVAEIDKRVVAFGQAFIKNKNVGILEKIYVDKRYRKKKIGMKIFKTLINWLKKKKVKSIQSGIYWKNKPSIKLNEKFGFKPVSLKMELKLK